MSSNISWLTSRLEDVIALLRVLIIVGLFVGILYDDVFGVVGKLQKLMTAVDFPSFVALIVLTMWFSKKYNTTFIMINALKKLTNEIKIHVKLLLCLLLIAILTAMIFEPSYTNVVPNLANVLSALGKAGRGLLISAACVITYFQFK